MVMKNQNLEYKMTLKNMFAVNMNWYLYVTVKVNIYFVIWCQIESYNKVIYVHKESCDLNIAEKRYLFSWIQKTSDMSIQAHLQIRHIKHSRDFLPFYFISSLKYIYIYIYIYIQTRKQYISIYIQKHIHTQHTHLYTYTQKIYTSMIIHTRIIKYYLLIVHTWNSSPLQSNLL